MNRYNILCVDDDEAIRELYEAAFAAWGHRVSTASSPTQALSALTTEIPPFDAVLLDYEMPEMNGAELAAEIKKNRPTLPVIMVSGNFQIMKDAPKYVDLALPKGSDLAQLISQIESLIGFVRDAKPPKLVRWAVADTASA